MKLAVRSIIDPFHKYEPRVKVVEANWLKFGFDYEAVVRPWRGWITKMLGLMEIVRDLPPSYTHLLFIDSRDVLTVAPPPLVMERWEALQHPWVYAAEMFIWPPDSYQPEDYPAPPGVYRYLNSGVMLGEIEHVRHWFSQWPVPTSCPQGDQLWMTARYLQSHPQAIKVDSECSLIQCMCGSLLGDNPNCVVTSGKVHNIITDTYPLIIHFNGGDDVAVKPEAKLLW